MSGWKVTSDHEVKRILLNKKDANGEDIQFRIRLERNYINLEHDNGAKVVFKRFLYRKKWLWHRNGKPRTHSQVVADLAAMLFGKDEQQAQSLINRHAPA